MPAQGKLGPAGTSSEESRGTGKRSQRPQITAIPPCWLFGFDVPKTSRRYAGWVIPNSYRAATFRGARQDLCLPYLVAFKIAWVREWTCSLP